MATTDTPGETDRGDELLMRILEAVGESSGTDPLALPLLENAIDTDVLTALAESEGDWELTFSYFDHLVTVDAGGRVQLVQKDTETDGQGESSPQGSPRIRRPERG